MFFWTVLEVFEYKALRRPETSPNSYALGCMQVSRIAVGRRPTQAVRKEESFIDMQGCDCSFPSAESFSCSLHVQALIGPEMRPAYLVNSMTDFITKWRVNGYRTSKSIPVVNHELFASIDKEVDALGILGVKVSFWHATKMPTRSPMLLLTAEANVEVLVGANCGSRCSSPYCGEEGIDL